MANRVDTLKSFAPRMYTQLAYIRELGRDDTEWSWEDFGRAYEAITTLLEDIEDACNRPRESDRRTGEV